MNFLKKLFLSILSLACFLGVGAVPIALERQAYFAEEEVKHWNKGQCMMEELSYREDNLDSSCVYQIDGRTYAVKRQTPVWNAFYDQVSLKNGVVDVFFRNKRVKPHRFTFKKGEWANFWYDPKDPGNSVLMPGAGSLTPFLYFGIFVYLALGILSYFCWKKRNRIHKA